jgi:hypothetical protein
MTSEQKGLRFAAGVTVATGLAMALSAVPALNMAMRLLADVLIWPVDGAETLLAPETRLGFAISGGVLVGWGLTIWHLAGEPFARAPEALRRIIRTSMLSWFVVDSTGSVAAGAALNVLANLVFLALFLIPLQRGRATALS